MKTETILDAAFRFAKEAHTSVSHAEAKDRLQANFPNASWDDIVDAYLKGCALVEKCYEIGEVARSEKIPDAHAVEILKERFPGFSDDTYNEALTLGWFLSR